MSAESDAEDSLLKWRQDAQRIADSRDTIILDAHRAGLTINRIHTISGISRSTIYRLLEATEAGE